MKKLIKLMIVAVVTTSVLMFTGCPTQNSDLDYPTYEFPIDLELDVAMADTDAVTMVATASTNAYATYHITIVGLVANMGDQFVIAGQDIGSDPDNIGANWNVTADSVTDTGLVGTISDDGTLDITFYGTSPSWSSVNSSMFKICEYDNSSWNTYFQTNGDNGYVNNSAASGACYDVDVTIDPNKL